MIMIVKWLSIHITRPIGLPSRDFNSVIVFTQENKEPNPHSINRLIID